MRNADLGYFDTAQFAEEEAADEYFFSRYKVGVKLFDEQGHELDVQDTLSRQAHGQAYEGQVRVSATRRVPARLLAVPVPEEVAVKRREGRTRTGHKHSRQPSARVLALCQWTILLTNIPAELLSVQEALVLLRLRWQVELLFKLWKQTGQVGISRSEQPWHVLCDLYAKLLGLLMAHWLLIVGCWQFPNRSMVKATQAIRSDIVLLARALSGKGKLEEVVQEMVESLDGCRMDSRHTSPNTYQLLLRPPSSSCNTSGEESG